MHVAGIQNAKRREYSTCSDLNSLMHSSAKYYKNMFDEIKMIKIYIFCLKCVAMWATYERYCRWIQQLANS